MGRSAVNRRPALRVGNFPVARGVAAPGWSMGSVVLNRDRLSEFRMKPQTEANGSLRIGGTGEYYAHLSLCEFCASFAPGARVLDAGCGTGYGAAHLLQRGATSVPGVRLI
jgi:SAM-dependent methyltransferase